MRDDDAVGLVLVEDCVDFAHQIEPILVDQGLAWQAAERDFLDCRDIRKLRNCASNSPLPRRFPASMYQAKSSRSAPTELIVPPVRINPTLGKALMRT